MHTYTTTIRLPGPLAQALEVVSKADNASISETVRVAIDKYIEARRADPAFQQRLAELFDSEREVFERLAQL
jgi:metal-responsive CopG/Arc/MetJ family transcriptional regulator